MLYRMLKLPIGALIMLIWRPQVRGTHHIPRRGGAIIACNHQSSFETLVMPALNPRVVNYLAKSDLVTGRDTLRYRLFARLLLSLGVLPVDRAGGQASSATIEAGARVLRSGRVLGIFPEGTRSPDGRLYRGKTGTVRLALATGVPIIPTAMLNSREAQGDRKLFPHRHPRITVVYGAPFYVASRAVQLRGEHDYAALIRVLTDELMARIQALSGQEYVDEYAPTSKDRAARNRKKPSLF